MRGLPPVSYSNPSISTATNWHDQLDKLGLIQSLGLSLGLVNIKYVRRWAFVTEFASKLANLASSLVRAGLGLVAKWLVVVCWSSEEVSACP